MTDDMNTLIRRALRGGPEPTSDPATARQEIGAAHGLPADLADRLRGANDRELAEDARNLAAALAARGVQVGDPPAHVSLDGGVRQQTPAVDENAAMNALIRSRTNAPR